MGESGFRIGFIITTEYWLLVIATLALFICPLPVLSEQIPQQDLDALQTQLEETGWRVQRSPSGDLLLWPPGREIGAQPAEVTPQDDSIPTTDLETLKKRLQDRGWRVEHDIDGSLLLYPREGEAGESVQPKEEQATGSERMDDLQRLLTNSGWRVRKTREGDLLLFPRPVAAQSSPPSGTDAYVRPSELWRVSDILAKAGWHLEKEPDGSILLFPETSRKQEGVRSGKRYVPGIVVSSLFRREVELPVDSWQEALRISNSWLADQQAKGLIVGKIRKINWIYLVSIIEDSVPHRLNNQLAIRETDGTVIPLF